jgi:hypothetical protein
MGPSLGEDALAEGDTQAKGHGRGSGIHEDERPFRCRAERGVHDRDHRLQDGDAQGESRQRVPHDAVASGSNQLRRRAVVPADPHQLLVVGPFTDRLQ